ncbi:hypothetical protein VTO73DRAFT_14556 [Trametes versicolor]
MRIATCRQVRSRNIRRKNCADIAFSAIVSPHRNHSSARRAHRIEQLSQLLGVSHPHVCAASRDFLQSRRGLTQVENPLQAKLRSSSIFPAVAAASSFATYSGRWPVTPLTAAWGLVYVSVRLRAVAAVFPDERRRNAMGLHTPVIKAPTPEADAISCVGGLLQALLRTAQAETIRKLGHEGTFEAAKVGRACNAYRSSSRRISHLHGPYDHPGLPVPAWDGTSNLRRHTLLSINPFSTEHPRWNPIKRWCLCETPCTEQSHSSLTTRSDTLRNPHTIARMAATHRPASAYFGLSAVCHDSAERGGLSDASSKSEPHLSLFFPVRMSELSMSLTATLADGMGELPYWDMGVHSD